MKGQLPKAYLRIDPNLDQTHPDPGAFIRLLCAAARQPKRGRFKDRHVADQALGRKAVGFFLQRHDLIERDGALIVDGWDIWQEGDVTVGERMRRYRARHAAVTEPSSVTPETPLPPSEASGVKASGERQQENERPLSVDRGGLTDQERQLYADAVWQAFAKASGKAERIMSPAEFAVVKRWMDDGIPLRIVLRGLQDCGGKGNTLTYYAGAVDDAAKQWARTVPL